MTLLSIRKVTKPWGRIDLPDAFGGLGTEPVGEIWFEPPTELDKLLI